MKKVHLVKPNRYTACGRRTFEVDCVCAVDMDHVTCKDCLRLVISEVESKRRIYETALLHASIATIMLKHLA